MHTLTNKIFKTCQKLFLRVCTLPPPEGRQEKKVRDVPHLYQFIPMQACICLCIIHHIFVKAWITIKLMNSGNKLIIMSLYAPTLECSEISRYCWSFLERVEKCGEECQVKGQSCHFSRKIEVISTEKYSCTRKKHLQKTDWTIRKRKNYSNTKSKSIKVKT